MTAKLDVETKFRQFHEKNPHVYAELVRLARRAKANGRRKIGIKMLWEVMRWDSLMTTGAEGFKLCNNYHSRYARLIMQQEPDLSGIFTMRRLREKRGVSA